MTPTSATVAARAVAGGAFTAARRATRNAFVSKWLAERGLAPRALHGILSRGAAFPAVLAASRR